MRDRAGSGAGGVPALGRPLDENDDLGEFDLDHSSLTETAERGVVYGLVVDRWKLAELRELLDDPEVATIRLTDVAFDLGGD